MVVAVSGWLGGVGVVGGFLVVAASGWLGGEGVVLTLLREAGR